MHEFDDFRKSIGDMVRESSTRARINREQLLADETIREERLKVFDCHADRLQDEVIGPRVKYVASLFDQAFEPEMREEHEYRHRIRLHFGHTDHFPCTADLVFLIVHCEMSEFFTVKFEYVILPAYITENYKFDDKITVPLDEASDEAVSTFTQGSIKTFLQAYLRAQR